MFPQTLEEPRETSTKAHSDLRSLRSEVENALETRMAERRREAAAYRTEQNDVPKEVMHEKKSEADASVARQEAQRRAPVYESYEKTEINPALVAKEVLSIGNSLAAMRRSILSTSTNYAEYVS